MAVTAAFRKAVLSVVPNPIPAQVSGHGARGRKHAGFFTLPGAGHEHADGHLLGLGLAILRGMPDAEWKQLVRAVSGGGLAEVRVRRDWTLRLAEGSRLRGLAPGRWTAGPDGARDWVTVTPVMCDGWLRRPSGLGALIRRSLVNAGFPDPGRRSRSPVTFWWRCMSCRPWLPRQPPTGRRCRAAKRPARIRQPRARVPFSGLSLATRLGPHGGHKWQRKLLTIPVRRARVRLRTASY